MKSELKATARLALPLAIAQLSTFVMGIVDTACVGRFAALDLAAVAIGNSIHWGFAALGMGVAHALDPLIAQAVGANEPDTAWSWFLQGLRVAVFVSVPLVLLELLVAANLTIVGIEPELAALVFDYCLFRAPAMILALLFFVTRSYLQAHELTRPVVLAALIANVVNLVSDVLLVFGDEALIEIGLPGIGLKGYGALGVGLTTLLSSVVMMVIVASYALRMRPKTPVPERPSGTRTLLRLSIPLGLQVAAEAAMSAELRARAAAREAAEAEAKEAAALAAEARAGGQEDVLAAAAEAQGNARAAQAMAEGAAQAAARAQEAAWAAAQAEQEAGEDGEASSARDDDLDTSPAAVAQAEAVAANAEAAEAVAARAMQANMERGGPSGGKVTTPRTQIRRRERRVSPYQRPLGLKYNTDATQGTRQKERVARARTANARRNSNLFDDSPRPLQETSPNPDLLSV